MSPLLPPSLTLSLSLSLSLLNTTTKKRKWPSLFLVLSGSRGKRKRKGAPLRNASWVSLLSFWSKGRDLGAPETNMQFRGNFLFSLGLVFGFSAFLLGSHEWGFGFAHNLFVVLPLLVLGFRVWGLSRRCDEFEGILGEFRNLSRNRRTGFCLDGGICALCGLKLSAWKGFNGGNCITCIKVRDLLREFEGKEGDEDEGEEKGNFDQDKEEEEDMVFKLRKVIERERKLREAALEELEKEWKAASSAADEAMAKILRLQDEKALIEREARQYREIAEQKQMHDQQVIDSLQLVVSRLDATMDEVLSLAKLRKSADSPIISQVEN